MYPTYLISYSLLGKRKMESFADLDEAKGAAEAAIKRIANNEQRVLDLKNEDRDVYLRGDATDAVHGDSLWEFCLFGFLGRVLHVQEFRKPFRNCATL
jgi:cell division septum initiation protein DivIVA